MTTDETHTDAPASLSDRAITVARLHRAIAPRAFADRHGARSPWNRRAITTSHIAAALGVNVDTVLVRDDPDRHYGTGATLTPGDLIEVTSDGRCWRFIPDLSGFVMWSWLLLGPCPDCEAPRVPVARVAGLADLGAYLDTKSEEHFFDTAPFEFHGDPAHRTHCRYSANASELRAGHRKEPLS
ncbi:hypothetical protein NQK81_27800 [Amycolatopsis roodepoortensis]|uniref:hypothetical protein n=1 Tax=Amycolatopsis roodepoortensis TaxID=700274 RepID=UPI00214B7718|nr:hypothetical protein [Amycolatopsis roodepoortensis]UUV28581.1 hypothetical protein NQK81_27800 [Amycolatopsis roodepoortensis]